MAAAVQRMSVWTFRDVAAVDKDQKTALHNICTCRSAIAAKLVDCLLEAGAKLGR